VRSSGKSVLKMGFEVGSGQVQEVADKGLRVWQATAETAEDSWAIRSHPS
jgi:hypothetical protein